jgi:Mce-associated membrane protein
MTIPAPPQIADTEEGVATPPRRLTGVATLVALIAVLVMAVGVAAWFRGEANQLTSSPAATNDALVDKDTTAQVSAQISDAVKRVYSYDFARLADNERAAKAVVTGPFVDTFQQQFAKIRQLAPPQQAAVVASVPAIAVKDLEGDRAIVLVFIDQEAHQAGKDKPLLATGRLSITAQRVDGRWKIADAESF